jgi:hypothetical protein
MVKKMMGKAPSASGAAASGLLIAILWTVVSALGIAKLVDMEMLPAEKVGYGSMLAVLSAVFVGASLAGKKAGHMVVQAAALSGGAYFLCLLLVNACFFGGSYTGIGITLLLVILATGIAIVAAGKRNGRSHRRRYKIPGK